MLETAGFLDLAAETRTQIYICVFDRASHEPGSGIIRHVNVRAKSTFGLLLVNRLIYSEALSVFYKYRHFSVHIQNLFSTPPSPVLAEESRFELLVHLELVYEDQIDKLDVPESDVSIYHHLRFVQERCLRLKYLTLELRSRHRTDIFPHRRYRSQLFVNSWNAPYQPYIVPTSSSGSIMQSILGNISGSGLGGYPPSLSMTYGGNAQIGMPLTSSPIRDLPAAPTPTKAMPPTLTLPMVSGYHVPGTTPRFGIKPLSRHLKPDIFLLFNMRPALRKIPSLPPPPPRMTQPRKIQIGTYFIDREGTSVHCLKEIWGRLEKLTIVVPEMGDFGEEGFQQYMYGHLEEILALGAGWDLRTVDYEGESMSMQGARLVEWSVSKELQSK